MEEGNSQQRSRPFLATRDHHQYEAVEDYTELVADLIEKKGEARTCDIAAHLGISHVSALRMMQRLQQQGYLKIEPHHPVQLTPKGKRLAVHCKQRHRLIIAYLVHLGVPENIAAIDAEGMEHHLSSQTLEAFRKHLYRNT